MPASQQILTGNLLVDGVTYHATDINAAINNATALPGIIESQPVVPATDPLKILTSSGTQPGGLLQAVTVSSVKTLAWTNLTTTGVANLAQGVALSGQMGIALVGGTINDWNPTGLATSSVIGTTGTATLTGVHAPATAGTILILVTLSGALDLKPLNGGSQSQNQFNWGAPLTDIVTVPGDVVTFMYINTQWFLLCTNRSGLH